MLPSHRAPQHQIFTTQFVDGLVQKMFSDPVFSVSEILRKFLSFIISETMEGRSHLLKEYTIGIKVLNKPPEFNPQTDGIVRIHAGRLRRALNQYYQEGGKQDAFRISIPKGNYIPFFYETSSAMDKSESSGQTISTLEIPENKSTQIKVAVLPFSYFTTNETIISFAEGMASQLSSSLASISQLTMIAYNPLRFLYGDPLHFKDALAKAGVQFIYSGHIQVYGNNTRINFQVINAATWEQIWSEHYDQHFEGSNMLDLQDTVVRQVIAETRKIWESKKLNLAKTSSMAVA